MPIVKNEEQLKLKTKRSKMKQNTTEVSVDRVRPNPYQPRTRFPEKVQHELMESIRQNGLVQPIVVRKAGDEFELLAGERRLRAMKDLGLPTITAHIRELNDEEMRTLSILENVQREDLNPIDLAKSYKALIEEVEYTQDKLASKLGKDRSTIANTLRLLELPEKIQNECSSQKISAGHARALLPLKDSPKVFALLERIAKEKWSVRETEKKVKAAMGQGSTTGPNKPSPKKQKDPNVIALEEQLSEHLDTKVEIWGETEGSIQVHFSSVKDFNRIFNLVLEKELEDIDE
jgi:ParB family chromosome partitioning protein